MTTDDEQEQSVGTLAEAAGTAGDASEVDADIQTAIRGGDRREAVRLCTGRYGGSIGRLCMAMVGTQAEAEDLTQETLLAAHDSFDSFRGDGSVRSWLFAIARRRCARFLEKQARRQSRLRLVYDSGKDADTEELVLRRQRAERARSALDHIRPSEREALLLRYGSDLSFKEVGAACGIDEVAARKRVSRAISRLRETLSKES